jgi:D-3-phosphoglycerate dehydrogenase
MVAALQHATCSVDSLAMVAAIIIYAGELLKKIGPYLTLADRMGCLLSQLTCGPLKEVVIEYRGNFQDWDMSPVSTDVLKGLLTPMINEGVNFVNAGVIAKDRDIKVTETSGSDAEEYINMIMVKAVTTEMSTIVGGTIFGKSDPRVVIINNFRLEMIPEGHSALIYNQDKPGAIGSVKRSRRSESCPTTSTPLKSKSPSTGSRFNSTCSPVRVS